MLVTNLVLPEDRVIFGVLTLIGSCMLLFTFLKDAVGRACLGSAFHSFQGRQFRCDRERHALQDFSADPFLGSFNAAVFI